MTTSTSTQPSHAIVKAADSTGRNLVISCGAALHHLRVAASASGLRPDVTRMPDPANPDLLARVRLTPVPRPPTSAADLRAIQDRRTDRRRFTSWPVPNERLYLLTQAVEDDGGDAVGHYRRHGSFPRRADGGPGAPGAGTRHAIVDEAEWTDRNAYDGLASTHLPARTFVPDALPSRFEDGLLADESPELETADGMIVVCGQGDPGRPGSAPVSRSARCGWGPSRTACLSCP